MKRDVSYCRSAVKPGDGEEPVQGWMQRMQSRRWNHLHFGSVRQKWQTIAQEVELCNMTRKWKGVIAQHVVFAFLLPYYNRVGKKNNELLWGWRYIRNAFNQCASGGGNEGELLLRHSKRGRFMKRLLCYEMSATSCRTTKLNTGKQSTTRKVLIHGMSRTHTEINRNPDPSEVESKRGWEPQRKTSSMLHEGTEWRLRSSEPSRWGDVQASISSSASFTKVPKWVVSESWTKM